MKLIILVAGLFLLAGCDPPRVRRDRNLPLAPIAEKTGTAPSIPNETAAVASTRPSDVSLPEIKPAAGLQRQDPAPLIAETNGRLLDVYFDYDRSELRSEALSTVQENAKLLTPILNGFPRVTVWIEGHCDERGS